MLLAQLEDAPGLVLYPPTIEWGFLFQRPHQILRELASRGYVAVFCSSDPVRDGVRGLREVEPRLWLTSDIRLFSDAPAPIVWLNWTVNGAFLPALTGPRVVYEYIDELDVFSLHCHRMVEDHHRLVRRADVVVASADRLHEELLPSRPDAVLAPNGVRAEDFVAMPPAPADLQSALRRGAPIVGYYGAIARWFDFDLFNSLTERASDLSFILIGPDYDGSLRRIHRRDNVFILGEKSYAQLPAYSHRFDVATIPFAVNEITRSTSPVKLFEYFATGLPVVTTPMDECRKYPLVEIAADSAAFEAAIRKSIALRKDPAHQRLLAEEAARNTWSARVDAVLKELAQK